MQAFEYASPATVKEAIALLGPKWGEADVLAGGTDLVSLMKDYVHTPRRVVNIKGIKELGGISKAATGLRIGALVTFDELLASVELKPYPAILAAVRGVASPQIRNLGTVGGDLCQRPRCWYFRGGFGLLGRHEGKNLVEEGDNRYHAIFGDGPAHFVSASSLGPALVALNARITVAGPAGNRTVTADKFFVSPRSDSEREIAIRSNELVTEITIPAAGRNATYEVRQKEALDWPLATASVVLGMKGSSVARARIVLGHVAPTPWVAADAEKFLVGKSLNADVAEEAGKTAVSGARPLSGNGYKVQLAKVAVKRALMAAAGVKA